MSMMAALAFLTAGLLSYLGIAAFRRISLDRNWFDIPNERSSHDRPTPRGAGLIVVVISLTAYIFITRYTSTSFVWAYFIGAALIAAISWLDDRYTVAFIWRLIIHIIAAALAVSSFGNLLSVGVQDAYQGGWLNAGFTALWIVWMINAYNFMDGIDGIAGVQAVIGLGAWAIVASRYGSPDIFLLCLVLAGACIGFLIHNWHPARIFLGDVGSAYLGYTFAVLPLMVRHEVGDTGLSIPIAGALFVWPFTFDSVFTFIRRLFAREPIWRPHRQHLYQRLVIAGYRHSTVSVIYGIFALIVAAATVYSFDRLATAPVFPIFFVGVSTLAFFILVTVLIRTPPVAHDATNGRV